MDDVPAAVRDLDDAAAETAWDGLRGPRAERGLAVLLEIEDAQIGGPVHVFLLIEARGDPHQGVAVIARRQLALVFRAGQVEIQLQPVGGAGRCRRQRGERRGKGKSEQWRAAGHDRAPRNDSLRRREPRTSAESRYRRARTARKRRLWRQGHALGFVGAAALQRSIRRLSFTAAKWGGADDARGVAVRGRRTAARRCRQPPAL